ncbi:MAG TPA: TIGR00725 family protein [Polyangiaceae bacterium]|nr:TIGR00725 family protein [Polyangiaceae bacterium]
MPEARPAGPRRERVVARASRRQRRFVVAVIGDGEATSAAERLAAAVGRGIVERGCRLVTGGLGGVMAAASRGAHRARGYREGDVIGILPGGDGDAANPWVDVAVPSGLGVARNVLVVQAADAVIAIGGRAGTLSELALAWQLGRPVVALDVPGWSARVAGRAIDDRRCDVVLRARDAGEAVALATAGLGARRRGRAGRGGDPGSSRRGS